MIKAYAAMSKGGSLELFEYEAAPLNSNEVNIKVESCGICHSDISAIDGSWGKSKYPMVAGHEVVGVVVGVGSNVSLHKIGDRVGLGWHSGYCNNCEQCNAGDHNFCSSTKKTVFSQHGGFAEQVTADEVSVIPIPSGLNHADAGPLLCGGITVFTPIVEFNINKNHSVGIIGIGGLGHLAIKFYKALGCHVTAFTNSEDKNTLLQTFGVDEIISSTNKSQIKVLGPKFDLIISTVNVKLDWNLFLSIIKPRGRLHFVGAVLAPIETSVFSLMGGRKSISGSPVGSPVNIKKMLNFCSKHKISPLVEHFNFDQINDAITKVRKNKVRFRAVLNW
ncbi:NAD(P)-dependent alcohol dehydrogenase [Methylophilaceae bacterium]|nr:NAD(P)-dependent alcohol dehydrogenase [Methylophilaceae bacterium]|tara:strand:+ start:4887 stop:5888 length:1002 start_codon:yes stop_codon:yes gene_type:complete